MYNFVFWFFYKFHQWRDKYDSVSLPSGAVMVTLIIHIGLVYSIFRFVNDSNPLGWGNNLSYGQRKYLMFPFGILSLVLIYFYYRKKSKAILARYDGKKPFTVKNILLIILIMVVPLIIMIRLTNMAL
jgi:hypothetical protein